MDRQDVQDEAYKQQEVGLTCKLGSGQWIWKMRLRWPALVRECSADWHFFAIKVDAAKPGAGEPHVRGIGGEIS